MNRYSKKSGIVFVLVFLLFSKIICMDKAADLAKQADIAKQADAARAEDAARATEADKQAKAKAVQEANDLGIKWFNLQDKIRLTKDPVAKKKLEDEAAAVKAEVDRKTKPQEVISHPIPKAPEVQALPAPLPKAFIPPVLGLPTKQATTEGAEPQTMGLPPRSKSVPVPSSKPQPAVVQQFEAFTKAEAKAKAEAELKSKQLEIEQLKEQLKGATLEGVKKQSPEDAKRIEEQRKRLAELQEQTGETTDEAKKKKMGKIVGIGVTSISTLLTALLGGGGTTGVILGTKGDSDSSGDPSGDGGVTTDEPSPLYDQPPISDPDYNNKLYLIANKYLGIKDIFKDAINNGKYESDIFEINIGEVTIDGKSVIIKIKYNFKEVGAGSVDMPLTLTLDQVEIYPDQIDGFAVTPDGLLSQIKDAECNVFTRALLKPSSGLIFIIKMGLLLNQNDSFTNEIAFANHVLVEAVLLICRLKWNNDLPISSILTEFPTWVDTYLKEEKKGKMFTEMVKIYNEASAANSAISATVSGISQLGDYKSKVLATRDSLLPKINSELSYADKLLLVHAISRLVYDLNVALPKTAKESKKGLVELLISVLTEVVNKMTDAKFEQKFIFEIQTNLDNIKSLLIPGKKVVLSRPRLGSLIDDVQSVSMYTVINTCLNHYSALAARKFDGDYGYLYNDFFLGRGETEDAMLAVWLRCMHDADVISRTLINTKKIVEIKKYSKFEAINPGEIASELIGKRIDELLDTQDKFKAANEALSKDKSPVNKKNYKYLENKLIESVQKIIDAKRSFVRQYAIYYPISKDDKTSLTVAEFAQREFAKIKDKGMADDKLFDQFAGIFQPFLGLPRDMIWVNTTSK